MEIKRTANAGVLLRLDDVSVLLDGVCEEITPYLRTPDILRLSLLENPADIVAFTHQHKDHYDAAFVTDFLKNAAGPILGPADIPLCRSETVDIGGLSVRPIETRHLGKAGQIQHVSYIVQGSACVWFTGDASPLSLARYTDLPRPDVLIAPYAYATAGGWEITKKIAPKALILVHLPLRSNDPQNLWAQVEETVDRNSSIAVYLPEIGQTIRFVR